MEKGKKGLFRDRIVEVWNGPGERDETIPPLQPEENALHRVEGKHYFEHWYFDAHLEGGYVVVGFLQTSELIHRKPGVELHVYMPSGKKLSVIKEYPQSEVRASQEKFDVWIGHNHGQVDWSSGDILPQHHFHLAEGNLEFDLTYYSEIPGWKPGGGKTIYGDLGYFAWVVPVPRARVEGTVRIGEQVIQARGIGYSDHNWGTVADMRKVVSCWYWGRLYAEDFTLLYAYVMTTHRFSHECSKPLMLAHRGEIILSTGEMSLTEGPCVFHPRANRDYPSWLKMEVPGRLTLELKVREIIDADDLIKDFNPFLKWVVNKFIARPGWFRFSSDYRLEVQHEGQSYQREGRTLHEMVALR